MLVQYKHFLILFKNKPKLEIANITTLPDYNTISPPLSSPPQSLPLLSSLNVERNPIRVIEPGAFGPPLSRRLLTLLLPSQGNSYYDCQACANRWLPQWLRSRAHFLRPDKPEYFYCYAEERGVRQYRPIIEQQIDASTCHRRKSSSEAAAAVTAQPTVASENNRPKTIKTAESRGRKPKNDGKKKKKKQKPQQDSSKSATDASSKSSAARTTRTASWAILFLSTLSRLWRG